MKRISFLLLALVLSSIWTVSSAQIYPANWPSADWTITGTYNADAAMLPTDVDHFTYDDDADGNGADAATIAAESPVIDLTSATESPQVTADYSYNAFGDDILVLQYWDADAATWVDWTTLPDNAGSGNFTSCNEGAFISDFLDISGFTATQKSNFKYRISYDDNGSWQYGFCLSSPTLTIAAAPAAPNCAINPDPIDGATDITVGDLMLLWDKATTGPDPTSYDLYAGTDAAALGLIANYPHDTANVSISSYATTFYWQIRPKNGSVAAEGCPIWSFTTEAVPPVPANDLCSGAIAVTCGSSTAGNTFSATIEENIPNCGGSTNTMVLNTAPGIWYSIVGDGNNITASLCGSSFDTKIGIFTGTCDALECVVGNDDNSTACSPGNRSQVVFPSVAGTTYYIYVTGYSTNKGPIVLDMTCEAPPACPVPSGLAVSGVTETGAEVAWTTGGSESWEVSIVADGAEPAAGTGTTDNPYTATGLTGATAYDVYVRDNCGGGLFSDWVGPISFTTPGPPPANDECAAAISVALTANCDAPVAGTVSGATDSGVGAPECDGYTGTADDDVWYNFVATANNVDIVLADEFDGVVALYSGTCDALTLVSCADLGADPTINATGLTAGDTYYVQVFSWSSSAQANGAFTLCLMEVVPPACPMPEDLAVSNVTETSADVAWTAGTGTAWEIAVQAAGTGEPTSGTAVAAATYSSTGLTGTTAYEVYLRTDCGGGVYSAWVGPVDFSTLAVAPANDECAAAISVALTANCDAPVAGTVTGATDSGVDAPECDGYTGTADDDVWYNFVATANNVDIVLADEFDGVVALYSGTCDALTLVDCADVGADPTINATGLTAGDTYYVQVFSWSSSAQANGAFTLCLMEVVPPACPMPEDLAVSNVTETSADVAWTAGTGTAWEIAVQAAGTGEPTSGTAVAAATYSSTGLTGTTAYEVYLRTDCGGGLYSEWVGPVNFSTLAVAPANDECAGAISVALTANCDAPVAGTVSGATDSGVGGPECDGYTGTADDDVWYNFVATANDVDIVLADEFDGVVVLYSGTCDDLTVVDCADLGTDPTINATGLTAGDTYYVQVFSWSSSAQANGAFTLCLMEVMPAATLTYTCPENMTTTAPTGTTAVVTWADPAASTTCATGGVTMTADPASGSAFAIGETTVTYTFTDECGNEETCSFTVTVEEEVVSTCPAVGAIVITEVMSNPTNASDQVGEWFEVYNTTAADIDMNGWTIKDDGSDSHVIEGSVVVPAGGYAVFARNADTEVNGGVEADYQYDGTLGNGFDELVLVCSGTEIDRIMWDDGATFPDGSGMSMSLDPAAMTATANDAGTNWCAATAAYGLGDLGTPGAANPSCGVVVTEITVTGCPADMALVAPAGGTVAASWTMPTATTTCAGDVTMTVDGPANGDMLSAGTYTVTYTYTDDCENEASCSFMITVEEEAATAITVTGCPADMALVAPAGGTVAASWTMPTATTTCAGDVTMTVDGPANGDMLSVGTYTVTYTYTDDCENEASCSFMITVEEEAATAITVTGCPADMALVAPAGGTVAASWTMPTATTTCAGDVTMTVDGPANGDMLSVGTYTVTYTYTDDCENEASCSFMITVTEEEPTSTLIVTQPSIYTVVSAGGYMKATYAEVCPNPTSANGLAFATEHVTLTAAEYAGQDLHVSGGCTPYAYEYWDEMTEPNMCSAGGMLVTRRFKVTDACGASHTSMQMIHLYEVHPTVTQTSTGYELVNGASLANVALPSCNDGEMLNGLPISYGISDLTMAQMTAQDFSIAGSCPDVMFRYWDTNMNNGDCDTGYEIMRTFLISGGCYSVKIYQSITTESKNLGGCGVDMSMFQLVGEYGGHTYYISNAIWNAGEATALASANGGYMATINSADENAFVASNVNEMFLIGLNDAMTEGNLEWANGEAVAYSNFVASTNNSNNNDYTVVHNWNDKWSMVNQWVEKKFLLEIDELCSGGSGDGCDVDMTQFQSLGNYGGHAYYISNSNMNWEAAAALAAQNSGYITSITSADENAFVAGSTGEIVFIGLNDVAIENTLAWANGEAYGYDNLTTTFTSNNDNNDYALLHSWDDKWSMVNQWVEKKFVLEVECGNSFNGSNNPQFAVAPIAANELKVSLNPNPANDYIQVMIATTLAENANLQILNSQGAVVVTDKGALVKGQNAFRFDVSNLPQGIYFLKVNTAEGQEIKKFIKQ